MFDFLSSEIPVMLMNTAEGRLFLLYPFTGRYFLFLSQAFRYMSHKFHGKASGKMKSEKRNKKHQEEMVSYEIWHVTISAQNALNPRNTTTIFSFLALINGDEWCMS